MQEGFTFKALYAFTSLRTVDIGLFPRHSCAGQKDSWHTGILGKYFLKYFCALWQSLDRSRKIGEKSEEKTSEDLPEFSFKKLSELGIFNEILFIYFFFWIFNLCIVEEGIKKIWREEFLNIERRFTALNRAKELTLSIKEAWSLLSGVYLVK